MTIANFIRANLRLDAVPALPDIVLYTAHPGSRLSRLSTPDEAAPYWAYQWAGGLALSLYLREQPQRITGKTVLDLGAGSGLVGIVAAKAGAIVSAAEIDANGAVAIALNAASNGVSITVVSVDIAGPAPAGFDTILAGDVFYDDDVGARMLLFLKRCAAAGMDVLIGDPDRRDLPLEQLRPLADYAVGDVGDARAATDRIGRVYALRD